jgi:hypothetical protein
LVAAPAVRYPRRLRSVLLKLSVALLAAVAIVGSGCAHTVRLDATPSGAHVVVNGQGLGTTPVDFRERNGWRNRYDVRIDKPGYARVVQRLQQSEWEPSVMLPTLALCWFPPAWPALPFSHRARHRDHWNLERAQGSVADGPGPAGHPHEPPSGYPGDGLPDDYRAPPSEQG